MKTNELLDHFMRTTDRRTFLKAFGVLGAGAVVGGTLQAVFKVIDTGALAPEVADTRVAMGTFVTVTAVDRSRDRAQEAIGRAFEEMNRLIGIYSRHDPASPLSELNSTGTLDGAPAELTHLIGRSRRIHDATGGAFDATVLPLVRLFEQTVGRDPSRVPDAAAVHEALGKVGVDNVRVDGARVRLERPGMALTLDAVAKGEIADRMSDVLVAHGVGRHLVNAGGDIRARGGRGERRPWTIAVEDPAKHRHYPDVLEITDGAVATSGSYEIYFDRDRRYYDIVDPHTGFSPTGCVSATVRATTVAEADALATALMVLGPGGGVRAVAAYPDAECLLIDPAGHIARSPGWSRAA